jgi:transposase
LKEAVDQVRWAESARLRAQGKQSAQRLKHLRWPLLRRSSRVRGRARHKLNALLASKLATAPAWDLKAAFSFSWKYKSAIWAGAFLDYWCFRAMRSRLQPMKKVARMLRVHEPLILNSSRAKGEISSGAVEGLNCRWRRKRVPVWRLKGSQVRGDALASVGAEMGKLIAASSFRWGFRRFWPGGCDKSCL